MVSYYIQNTIFPQGRSLFELWQCKKRKPNFAYVDVEVVCDLFDPSSKIIKLFRENNPVCRQFGTLANKNKGIVIIINWKKLWSRSYLQRLQRNIHNKTLTLKWNQYKESIPRFCLMLSLFCSEKFDLVENTILTRITKSSFWDLSSIRNF